MKFKLLIALAIAHSITFLANAHESPTSYLEIDSQQNGLVVSLVASAPDLTHGFSDLVPAGLLQETTLHKVQDRIAEMILTRFSIATTAGPLVGKLVATEAIPSKEDVRLVFNFPAPVGSEPLSITCALFPYDSRHQTFLTLTDNGKLIHQETFTGPPVAKQVLRGEVRNAWIVAWEFIKQGVHHIFIGVDHILFIVGLLLLGGTLRRLLSIVTAFTIAHSITLVLATLQILTPPSKLVESLIALSIVIVGAHAYLHRGKADHRLWLAFALGLLHGFGFASVLQEINLPTTAFVTSLASFNIGVELGQAAIILLCVPLLRILKNRLPRLSHHVLASAALAIVFVGSYWFIERVNGA